MKTTNLICLFLATSILPACDWAEDDTTPRIIEYSYNFNENMEGWVGGFADLPEEGQDIYDLEVSHSPLPEEIDSNSGSIKVQGNNRSDDLFMFLKKQVTGLSPSTTYQITFDLEIASQYPASAPGAGGSPGSSVYLKAGATPNEPLPVAEDNAGVTYLRMNIEKGNQSQEGTDMINLGHIGIEGDEYRYELIRRGTGDQPFSATTDADGTLWLIIGTDSGFEGLSVLYYNSIHVRLAPTRIL
jgi:hypothetical protein